MQANEESPDWFDELNDNQKDDILIGSSEADRGETISHEEAVIIFKEWGLR